jgi:hypothetical protein
MRKLALVLILLVSSGLAGANAPAASADPGAAIKGVGGGWVGFPPETSPKYVQFSFSAHTGPNGDFGQAQFSISAEFGFPFDLSANVDCVSVFPVPGFQGGTWFSGLVTKVNDPTGTYFINPGDRVYFSALDGGDPSNGPVDDFEAWYDLHVPCKDLTAYVEPPDVTQGNIVISLG